MRRWIRACALPAVLAATGLAAASPASAATPTPRQQEVATLTAALPHPSQLGVWHGKVTALGKPTYYHDLYVCNGVAPDADGYPVTEVVHDTRPGTGNLQRDAYSDAPTLARPTPGLVPISGQELAGVFDGNAVTLMRRAATLCSPGGQVIPGVTMHQSIRPLKVRTGWTGMLTEYTLADSNYGACETRVHATAGKGHDLVEFALVGWSATCGNTNAFATRAVKLLDGTLAKLH